MKFFLALALTLPLLSTATEYSPWFDVDLRPDFKSSLLYQSFDELDTDCRKRCYPSDDLFLTQSLGLSKEMYAGEAEICAAITRKQHFRLDHFKLTGRYRVLDDIVLDPISLVVGLSLIQAGRPALYDPASFHHGIFGVEAFVSAGKEVSAGRFWLNRKFAMLALGFSRGFPWMRAEINYSKNFCDQRQIDIFAKSLVGFGTECLSLRCFDGYGYVQHRSIDLGVKYSHFLPRCGATLSVELAYRVYAKNFPENASRLTVSYLYPFGCGL